MSELQVFSSYVLAEGKTGIGDVVSYTCRPEEKELVREFLEKHVRTVSYVETQRIISHGGCGCATRFDVVQHRYAGGGPGFIEVLEIKDPPDNREMFVVYDYNCQKGSSFTEWSTLEYALSAWDHILQIRMMNTELKDLPGFIRFVKCDALTPWFYAGGTALIVGDYVFPDGLQDDPVFTFGRRFLVHDYEGIPSVKKCMGTRVVKERQCLKTIDHRTVYWSDGTTWNEERRGRIPRPLDGDELWIEEAMHEIKLALTGRKTEFSIPFLDGTKFVGKIVPSKTREHCAEGQYDVIVLFRGKKKSMRGSVDFTPTPECPDVASFVVRKFAESKKTVQRVEIKGVQRKRGGKKWSGVFFDRTR
jgi:hypothetical protein